MNAASPIVASIVVTYNGSQWVDACFSSLTTSDHQHLIIAIDNHSSDDTVIKLKRHFPEVVVIENKHNAGFGEANNQGIKLALERGAEFFLLLNQDAWVEPGTISSLITLAQSAADFGIVSPLHYNGPGTSLDAAFSGYLSKMYDVSNLERYRNAIHPVQFINAAAWMVSRECFRRAGGFGYLFPHYGEDRDLVQRANYHNLKIGFTSATKIYHDRPARRFEFESAEKMTWYYSVGVRVRLSDINKSYVVAIVSVLGWLTRDLIYQQLKGKSFALRVWFRIVKDIFIKSSSKIRAYRRIISSGEDFIFLK